MHLKVKNKTNIFIPSYELKKFSENLDKLIVSGLLAKEFKYFDYIPISFHSVQVRGRKRDAADETVGETSTTRSFGWCCDG